MLRQGVGCSRGGAGTGTGYRSRRAHTKTRTGCRTCRQRKVKCDETRPVCINCSKRGLHSECEYRDTVVWVHQMNPHPTATATPTFTPSSTSATITTTTSPTPGTPSSSSSHQSALRSDASASGSTPELSPGSSDMSRVDPNIPPHAPTQNLTAKLCTSNPTTTTSAPLAYAHGYTSSRNSPAPVSLPQLVPTDLTTLRLLHLFTTTTSLSLSTRPVVRKVWQTYVPTLALRLANYPDQAYLLHAVLAVAGLHAAKIRFNEVKQKKGVGKKRKWERERKEWLVVASEEYQLCLGGFQAIVARYASRGVGKWIYKNGDPAKEGNHVGDNINSPRKDGEDAAFQYHGGGSREEEELEAVFIASVLLCIYGCSITTMGIDQEIDREAKRKASSTSLSPSSRVPSPPTPLPAPLTWLPLARGIPAIIYSSPALGWRIVAHGRLAPLTTGMDSLVPHHPYAHVLSSLQSLLSSDYELHPRLPQPTSPLTISVYTKVMEAMKLSFERFFAYEDPVAAVMGFPVTVNSEFATGLLGRGGGGVGPGGDREEWDGITGRVMDRDPRSLVIMAHFMVLMVIIEYLLPGEKEVVGLVKGEWRGNWDEDGSEDGGDESDGDNYERGLEQDARHLNSASPQSTYGPSEVRPCVTRGWWISGLGKHEIVDIARYLSELDAEEARVDGLVLGGGAGRWSERMKWPLEMIQGDVAARAAHDYVPEGIIHVKNRRMQW